MATPPLIRTFSIYCHEKFGAAVGKIPLDLGFICPNREKGGCIYCHAPAFSPAYLNEKGDIYHQVKRGKQELLKGRFKKYFLYFQQETPTTGAEKSLLSAVDELGSDDDCVGLIISTRPDYLDKNFLNQLAQYLHSSKKTCLFELGLQSTKAESLELLNRNHSLEDFLEAVALLRSFTCFQIGAHLLFGIPQESEDDMVETVRSVCSIGVDALKLHHLQVLKETPLAKIYQREKFPLFSKDDYLTFLTKILPLIPQDTVIHRLWATSHPDMLIAPRWNVLATQLSAELHQKMAAQGIYQGCLSSNKV